MTYINPEFQRNLWQEMNFYKMAATPFVLLAVLALGYYAANEWVTVVDWAVWLFTLITIVYGSYLAGDTIADEVQEHTWPLQRLMDIAPWSMTWGKAFGGTSFAWYVGFWCLLVIVGVPYLGLDVDNEFVVHAFPISSALHLVAIAAFFQAFSLLFSLIHLQKTHSMIKRTIFIPIIALVLATLYVPYLLGKIPTEAANIVWYHRVFPEHDFFIVTVFINAAWMLCGAYMFMRHELQYVNTIWVWLGFLSFQVLYFLGFTVAPDIAHFKYVEVFDRTLDLPIHSLRIGIAFLVCLLFTYVMAAIERVEVLEIKKALSCKVTGKFKLIFNVLPRWVPSLLITAVLALAMLILIAVEGYFSIGIAAMVLALLGFVLRDIGLFMLFDMVAGKKRHVTTALVYMVLLYLVIPGCLAFLHFWILLPLFVPHPEHNILTLAAPIAQAIIVWIIALRRFDASTGG